MRLTMRHLVIALLVSVGWVVVGCAGEQDEGTESSEDQLKEDDDRPPSKTKYSPDKREAQDGLKCSATDECPRGQVCWKHFCEYR